MKAGGLEMNSVYGLFLGLILYCTKTVFKHTLIHFITNKVPG